MQLHLLEKYAQRWTAPEAEVPGRGGFKQQPAHRGLPGTYTRATLFQMHPRPEKSVTHRLSECCRTLIAYLEGVSVVFHVL